MSPTLGTTVRDVDLREPLRADQVATLRAALERSYLLHLPAQDLSDEQHGSDPHNRQLTDLDPHISDPLASKPPEPFPHERKP